jgi:hypothetical protein
MLLDIVLPENNGERMLDFFHEFMDLRVGLEACEELRAQGVGAIIIPRG